MWLMCSCPFNHSWLLLLIVWTSSVSSRSNNNYNVYQYDRTAMQFTPDGRLLQVEYASAAADHSTPVVVVPVSSDLILICTTRRAQEPTNIYQERLVLVPTGSTAGTTMSSGTEEYVVVALSGVLADSLALLEAVQEERFQQHRTFGEIGGNVPARVTRTIADKCQSHAFGGGLRPFGSTLLVCGVTEDGSAPLYQTDPSGAILEVSDLEEKNYVVVGGDSRPLKQRLTSYFSAGGRTQIGDILSIVLEEQTKEHDDKVRSGFVLEAVLVSKAKGVLKLSNKQVESLLNQRRI